ncbi:MAG: hypothetical protein WD041_00640 [Nitriliruptoraceae bacterium]
MTNTRGIRHRLLTSTAGEGVISAAIVVLIMAVIGAGLYVAFNRTVTDAAQRIEQEVQMIGG